MSAIGTESLGFDDELAVLSIETHRSIGLVWVGVFADERFKLGDATAAACCGGAAQGAETPD